MRLRRALRWAVDADVLDNWGRAYVPGERWTGSNQAGGHGRFALWRPSA